MTIENRATNWWSKQRLLQMSSYIIYHAYSFGFIYTQKSRNCNSHSFILFFFPIAIATALLDDNVNPVGEHDGDHH